MKFYGAPYPITKDAKGFFHVQSGINQIKSDLLALLLTNPGERCLAADTRIFLCDGTNKRIINLVGEKFKVFSYDISTDKLEIGDATAYKTATNAELVEVILDNHQVVVCTPDHLWLLKNKTYMPAQFLTTGTPLMGLTKAKANNKVVDVRKLHYKEDCYDLRVEKYHNFALTAGCFVHNCMLPAYGTPLKELIFEPNDSVVAKQAEEMIATAIKNWEPRVVIQSITVTTPQSAGDFGQNELNIQDGHVLGINIQFFDPDNIQDVQALTLELPLAT